MHGRRAAAAGPAGGLRSAIPGPYTKQGQSKDRTSTSSCMSILMRDGSGSPSRLSAFSYMHARTLRACTLVHSRTHTLTHYTEWSGAPDPCVAFGSDIVSHHASIQPLVQLSCSCAPETLFCSRRSSCAPTKNSISASTALSLSNSLNLASSPAPHSHAPVSSAIGTTAASA